MYVYYLEDPLTHEIKIGRAMLPRHRIQTLQTGNPRTLIVHGWHEGSEKVIHAKFADQRINGTEWFLPSDELHQHIKQNATFECGRDSFSKDYEMIRAAIIAEPDKSFSWHSADLGKGPTVIRNVYLELVEAGVIERPTLTRSKDGRSLPSIKPKTRKKPLGNAK